MINNNKLGKQLELKLRLFKQTKNLEQKVDRFFLLLSEASVIYRLGIRIYLREQISEEYTTRLNHICEIESEADILRREIEKIIYSEMLIPDARGDVLGLIETADEIFSLFKSSLWNFSNETPKIEEDLISGYRRLTNMVVKAVDELTSGCRAFFLSPHLVSSFTGKVILYEKEADKIGASLKMDIFSMDIELPVKIHLREFVDCIDIIADHAEDVADRLSIYAIKRQS